MSAWAAPVEGSQDLVARGGTCLIGCTSGTETLGILTGLQNSLRPKLKVLDDCYTDGTDPTTVMNDIRVLFDTAGFRIQELPKDMTGQLNGKGPDIVKLWTSILIEVCKHFEQWHHKSDLNSRGIGDVFAGLSQQVGAAVAALQGALTGVLGGLQSLGSQLLDAAKPHWEQLQEQLLGHGLNVLGSLLETLNNVWGSIIEG